MTRKFDTSQGKEEAHPSLLSDDEVTAFVETALKTSGKLSGEEIERLVEWAESARLFAMMVDMVIRGEIGIAPGEDDPEFVSPNHTKEPLR